MQKLIPILLNVMIFGLLCMSACGSDEASNDGDVSDGDTDQAEGEGEEAPVDNGPPDTKACGSAVVTSGFGYAWQKVNHRISWMKIEPVDSVCEAPVDASARLEAGFIGGNWSTGETMTDTPVLSYAYQAVSAPGTLGFHEGSIDFVLEAPANELEQQVSIDLKEFHLGGFDDYLVLINGIELDTRVDEQQEGYPEDYDPYNGYTSRGLGAKLSIDESTDDGLSFTAWLRFDHGPSDRKVMNEALPYVRTSGRLHYLVVGVEGGEIKIAAVDYRLQYDKPDVLTDVTLEHAEEEQRQVRIQLSGDANPILLGWSGFDFRLDEEGTADDEGGGPIGYYMREISLAASIADFDAESRSLLVDLDGYASNSTGILVYYPFDNHFIGEAAVISAAGIASKEKSLEEEFETGELTLPLEEAEK